MATVEDLVLTMSRNTKNEVAVKVSYTVHFSPTDRILRMPYGEHVELWEREGKRRDDDPANYQVIPVLPIDPPDRYVATIKTGGVNNYVGPDPALANPLDSVIPPGQIDTPGVEKLPRSWERLLTAAELIKLRDVGREHPYVKVTLVPFVISGDSKTAELVIDIGDPGE